MVVLGVRDVVARKGQMTVQRGVRGDIVAQIDWLQEDGVVQFFGELLIGGRVGAEERQKARLAHQRDADQGDDDRGALVDAELLA